MLLLIPSGSVESFAICNAHDGAPLDDVLPEEVVDDVPQTIFWKLFPVPLLL